MKKILVSIICVLTLWGCSKDAAGPTGSTGGGTGQGGSLARFTISQNHLYVVENRMMKVFSLSNPTDPQLVRELEVGTDVETIYVYENMLFIGSQQAMYIYAINNPSSPQYLGEASHVRACDPVVADGTAAYVTVREGTTCGGTTNALYVYDVSNVLVPQQKKVMTLQSPWGLGIRGDRLYVCGGGEGLIVYDITDRYYPSQVKIVTGEIFYDVIVVNNDNLLICMIEGGMAIYQVNGDNLTKLARIVN